MGVVPGGSCPLVPRVVVEAIQTSSVGPGAQAIGWFLSVEEAAHEVQRSDVFVRTASVVVAVAPDR